MLSLRLQPFVQNGTLDLLFFSIDQKENRCQASLLLSEISSIGNRYGFPVVDIGKWWGQVDMRSVTNSVVDSHPNERECAKNFQHRDHGGR